LYQESEALDVSATTQARIAQCLEHEGRLVSALSAYEEALRLVDRLDPARKRRASELFPQQIAALAARVPKLRLEIAPPLKGLAVEIDGRTLRDDELAAQVLLDPGRHAIRVDAAGFAPVQCEFEATEGGRVEAKLEAGVERREACVLEEGRLIVSLPQAPARTSEAAATAAASNHQDERVERVKPAPAADTLSGNDVHRTQRTFGWALGGAGLAALGTAAYFGIRTLSLVSEADCDAQNRCSPAGQSTIDRASHAQTAGFVAAGTGVALVAGGVALLLVGRKPARQGSASGQTIVVHAMPQGVSFVATW
jgi:hypothetical protein